METWPFKFSQGISLEIIKPAVAFISSLFKDRTPFSFFFFYSVRNATAGNTALGCLWVCMTAPSSWLAFWPWGFRSNQVLSHHCSLTNSKPALSISLSPVLTLLLLFLLFPISAMYNHLLRLPVCITFHEYSMLI